MNRTLHQIEKFISPEPNSGCWLWTSWVNDFGYGRVKISGKAMMAHRAVWVLSGKSVPDGSVLDHLCKNPACVNPDHLEPVTQSKNVLRGDLPKVLREKALLRTHCPHGHLLSGPNLYLRNRGKFGQRECRICISNYHKRRAAARSKAAKSLAP